MFYWGVSGRWKATLISIVLQFILTIVIRIYRNDRHIKNIDTTVQQYQQNQIADLHSYLESLHYADVAHVEWLICSCDEKMKEELPTQRWGRVTRPIWSMVKMCGVLVFGVIVALLSEAENGSAVYEGTFAGAITSLLTIFSIHEMAKLIILGAILAILLCVEWCAIVILSSDMLNKNHIILKRLKDDLLFVKAKIWPCQ